jgi:hypothetical protein
MTGAQEPVPHEQLTGVPYWRLQGGTFAMIVDPQPGDIGVVVFMSRDATGVINQALGQGLPPDAQPLNPSTPRKYDWSDSFYLGGWLNSVPRAFLQWDGSNLNISVPDGNVTVSAKTFNVNGAMIDQDGEVTDANGIVLGTHVRPAQGSLVAPPGGGAVTGNVGAPE